MEDSGLHLPKVNCRLKIVDQRVFALYASVSQFADFLAVESFPSLTVQVLVEGDHEDGVAHVDEGVPYVAIVFEVDG